mmetsp:Transcript_33213/g.106034  ORF Transcript_33213/g.106034 Transcript_33213/m.106034 type:complete len:229 (+) Transcript_33213:39-725(+)
MTGGGVFKKSSTTNTKMLTGVYSDPNHAIAGTAGGLRAIGVCLEDVFVLGCDDGETWWTLLGKVTREDSVTVDFGPKAPRVGVLAATASAEGLTFADGNTWRRLPREADIFEEVVVPSDATPEVEGAYRDDDGGTGLAGLHFVSKRLGKTEREEVVVVESHDGRSFFARPGGCLDEGLFGVPGVGDGVGEAHVGRDGRLRFLLDDTVWTKLRLKADPHALVAASLSSA